MAGVNPSPGTVFWESLKQGMVVWPFETTPGEYFAVPFSIAIPALMLLIGAPLAVAFVVVSRSRRDKNPS
jgi:hypothetical protein